MKILQNALLPYACRTFGEAHLADMLWCCLYCMTGALAALSAALPCYLLP